MPSRRQQGAQRRAGGAFVLENGQPARVMTVLAIDPGAALKQKTNGMALFHRRREGKRNDWTVQAWSESTMDMLAFLDRWMDDNTDVGVLVVEEFRLYPWALQEQGFTSLGTVEVIGALRYLVARRLTQPVPVVMQQASIKQYGQRYMDTEGIEHVGSNVHARDAEMHGWYWIGRKLRD